MRQCEVYVNGCLSGILTEKENPREYIYKYDEEYIRRNGDAVSLTLPLKKEAYTSPRLFPYFFNMLSEGENRLLQASLLHIDKDDDFGILLATAQYDTVGAVTIKPII